MSPHSATSSTPRPRSSRDGIRTFSPPRRPTRRAPLPTLRGSSSSPGPSSTKSSRSGCIASGSSRTPKSTTTRRRASRTRPATPSAPSTGSLGPTAAVGPSGCTSSVGSPKLARVGRSSLTLSTATLKPSSASPETSCSGEDEGLLCFKWSCLYTNPKPLFAFKLCPSANHQGRSKSTPPSTAMCCPVMSAKRSLSRRSKQSPFEVPSHRGLTLIHGEREDCLAHVLGSPSLSEDVSLLVESRRTRQNRAEWTDSIEGNAALALHELLQLLAGVSPVRMRGHLTQKVTGVQRINPDFQVAEVAGEQVGQLNSRGFRSLSRRGAVSVLVRALSLEC